MAYEKSDTTHRPYLGGAPSVAIKHRVTFRDEIIFKFVPQTALCSPLLVLRSIASVIFFAVMRVFVLPYWPDPGDLGYDPLVSLDLVVLNIVPYWMLIMSTIFLTVFAWASWMHQKRPWLY